MTAYERAYILRIAAIRETNESAQGVRALSRALRDISPLWTDAAIDRAVAYVRAGLDRLPWSSVPMELAA